MKWVYKLTTPIMMEKVDILTSIQARGNTASIRVKESVRIATMNAVPTIRLKQTTAVPITASMMAVMATTIATTIKDP